MEEEKLQLSDLRKADAVVPRQALTDFITPANQLDPIFNNTSIEDRVMATDGALLDGTIAQRTQRLNDKKNKYNLLNSAYANAEENIIRETQGQGITELGRRSTLITNQRILDAKRQKELADIEELRGNIETAEELRRASAAAAASAKSKTWQKEKKNEYIAMLKERGESEAVIATYEAMTDFQFAKNFFYADTQKLSPEDLSYRQQEFVDDSGNSIIPPSVSLALGFSGASRDDDPITVLGNPTTGGVTPSSNISNSPSINRTNNTSSTVIDPEVMSWINALPSGN